MNKANMDKNSIRKRHDGTIECEIAVMIIKDDDNTYTAYCPALQLSTYGDSPEDVQEAFAERLAIFMEEMAGQNVLHQELIRLGWNYEASKTPHLTQPENVTIPVHLLNSSFGIIRKPFRVPVYA